MLDQKGLNKLKIVYLLEILQKKTDAENGLTMTEIFEELFLRSITAGRKSIYNDIEMLRQAGYQIEKRHGKTITYHLVDNNLSAASISELSLAAFTSPYLSSEKANKLSMAVSRLTTDEHRAEIVSAMLHLKNEGRIGLSGKMLSLLNAADEGIKVSFLEKGKRIRASVLALTIADDVPYLIYFTGEQGSPVRHVKIKDITDIEWLSIKSSMPTNDEPFLFDILSYRSDFIAPEKGHPYDIEIIVKENSIIDFLERFIGDRLEGDAKTARISETEFRVNMTGEITADLIDYLYRNAQSCNTVSPPCLREKLSRIKDYTNI